MSSTIKKVHLSNKITQIRTQIRNEECMKTKDKTITKNWSYLT